MKPRWPLLVLSALRFEGSSHLLQLNYGFLQESPCFPACTALVACSLLTFVKYSTWRTPSIHRACCRPCCSPIESNNVSLRSGFLPFFLSFFLNSCLPLAFVIFLELRNKGMGNLAPFLRFLAHYLIVSQQTQIIGYRWSNILAPFPALTAQQLKAGPGCGQG